MLGDGIELHQSGPVEKVTFNNVGNAGRKGEIRTTSSTGAEKGMKPERYDLIPVEAMAIVARLYGKGAEKYAAHNWRKGYEWSKSYSAMQRHGTQFWGGEDIDEEMGLPHLAGVVFHALGLMTFMIEHPEFDDRYKPEEVKREELYSDALKAMDNHAKETELRSRITYTRDNEEEFVDWMTFYWMGCTKDNVKGLMRSLDIKYGTTLVRSNDGHISIEEINWLSEASQNSKSEDVDQAFAFPNTHDQKPKFDPSQDATQLPRVGQWFKLGARDKNGSVRWDISDPDGRTMQLLFTKDFHYPSVTFRWIHKIADTRGYNFDDTDIRNAKRVDHEY